MRLHPKLYNRWIYILKVGHDHQIFCNRLNNARRGDLVQISKLNNKCYFNKLYLNNLPEDGIESIAFRLQTKPKAIVLENQISARITVFWN